jgi:AraC-like DNA-binding protein
MTIFPPDDDLGTRGCYFFHLDQHLPRNATIGRERQTRPTYSWHGLERRGGAYGLFQYTLRGRGVLERGGVRHVLTPGQAFLVEIPDDHHYYLPAGWEPWEFFYIFFNGADFLPHINWITTHHGSVLTMATDHPALTALADLSTAIRHGDVATPEVLAVWLYRFLMLVRGGLQASDTATPAPLARALQYLETHFADDLSIARLAEIAGLSRAHFVRTFCREIGMPPHAYLTRMRLQRALYLLHSTLLPLEEIARQCGFAAGNYFGKVFRRVLGITPQAYRQGGTPRIPADELLAPNTEHLRHPV